VVTCVYIFLIFKNFSWKHSRLKISSEEVCVCVLVTISDLTVSLFDEDTNAK